MDPRRLQRGQCLIERAVVDACEEPRHALGARAQAADKGRDRGIRHVEDQKGSRAGSLEHLNVARHGGDRRLNDADTRRTRGIGRQGLQGIAEIVRTDPDHVQVVGRGVPSEVRQEETHWRAQIVKAERGCARARPRPTDGVVCEDARRAKGRAAAPRHVESLGELLCPGRAIAEVMTTDGVREVRNWNERLARGRPERDEVIPWVRQAIAEEDDLGEVTREGRRREGQGQQRQQNQDLPPGSKLRALGDVHPLASLCGKDDSVSGYPPYSGSATLPSGSRVFPSGSRLRIAVTARPSASRVSNSSARPASTSCWTRASRSGPGDGSACDFQRITKYPRPTCGRRASARWSSWSPRSSWELDTGLAAGRGGRTAGTRPRARS